MQKTTRRSTQQLTGDAAELSAARFLESQGLVILDRNHVRRMGELDLVCVDPADRSIVFVEVRYRRNHRYGSPVASITPRKIARLRLTARAWLQRHADPRRPARIDVIGISPCVTQGVPADNGSNFVWENQHLIWVRSAC